MKKAEFVNLGKVLRSDGKEGFLKVRPYEGVLRELKCSRLHLQRGPEIRTFEVESLYFKHNSFFVKLKGMDSLAQADAFAGAEVLADPECFERPEEGSFYEYEIVGCRVETVDGLVLGEVESVMEAGSGLVLSVVDGKREVLVPFVSDICVRIEPERGLIVVDPPEGLLDLNEN